MMILFPISTEVHDGRVRLAAVWITLACLLTHLFVMSDASAVNKRIDQALEEFHQSLPELPQTAARPATPEEMLALVEQMQTRSAELEQEQRAIIQDIAETSLLYRLGLVPARLSVFALFTYMFVHSGWVHLLGNLLFFYVCGVAMEKYWGFWRFAGAYVTCGVVAALVFLLTTVFAPPEARSVPLVGASGAIAGAMGAFMITHTRTRVKMFYLLLFRPGTFSVPSWAYLSLWFAGQVASVLFEPPGGSGVAYSAHVGGFVCGLLMGLMLKSEDEAAVVATPRELLALQRQKSRTERVAAAPTPLERAMAGTPPVSAAASGVAALSDALQSGNAPQALAVLSRSMNSMLQSAQSHRAEIADTLRLLASSGVALALNPQELYLWGRALEREGMGVQAIALFDRAASSSGAPQTQLRCLLAAVHARLHAGIESDRARTDAERVATMDGTGLFGQEARRVLATFEQS